MVTCPSADYRTAFGGGTAWLRLSVGLASPVGPLRGGTAFGGGTASRWDPRVARVGPLRGGTLALLGWDRFAVGPSRCSGGTSEDRSAPPRGRTGRGPLGSASRQDRQRTARLCLAA